MANVGFKLGLQSKVDELIALGTKAGAVEGSFYLTSDTNRLYIGKSDTSLMPVNEGVVTVSSLSDLPTLSSATDKVANTGRFYYVSGSNILCVYNGSQWVQINANTNTTISGNEFSVASDGTVTNKVSSSDNSYKEASFSVVGANGVTISGTGTTLTITGDKYSLGTADNATSGVDIQLNSANTDNDTTVTLAPAADAKNNNNVTISQSNGVISIAAKDSQNSSLTIANQTDGFKITVTDNYGKTVTGTVAPKIAYGANGDSSASFANGTATLSVYTKAEVDETLRVLNAMTYRGTVGTTGATFAALPTSDVSIGDTFLISTTGITYGGKNLSVGTLLIARGTEDSTGKITSSTLTYDIVESTTDTDTTFKFLQTTATNGGGIKLRSSTGADVGTLTVVGDDASTKTSGGILVTPTNTSGASGDTVSLKISHQTVTQSNTTGTAQTQGKVSSLTIPAITGVTVDSAGHVTGVETTSYTVTDTNSAVDSNAYDTSVYTSGTASVGVIKSTVTTKNSAGSSTSKAGNFTLSSESLSITDNDNRATASGGTTKAAGLQIDMVWGTF
jgi:hypothetical protein